MRALQRGPEIRTSPPATAIKSTNSIASVGSTAADNRSIFDARMTQIKQQHKYELDTLKRQSDNKIAELNEAIDSLEGDLNKTQEASQVLVEHVTSLEAQLNTRGDTERFLATKIATLDAELSSVREAKAKLERQYQGEMDKFIQERDHLRSVVHGLRKEKEDHCMTIEQASDVLVSKGQWEMTINDQTQKIRTLEADCKKLRADSAALEKQLGSKQENERTLAQQVSSLANQLAHVSERSNFTTSAFHARVRELETERETLRETVGKLSKQLYKVANFLDEMTAEQQTVIDEAAAHDAEMTAHFAEHAKIVDSVKHSQKQYEEALEHQARIGAMLRNHEVDLEMKNETHKSIVEKVETHSRKLIENRTKRQNLVQNVTELKSQLVETKASVIDSLPKKMDESDGDAFVDEVIKHVLSPAKTEPPTPVATEYENPAIESIRSKEEELNMRLETIIKQTRSMEDGGAELILKTFPLVPFEDEKKGDDEAQRQMVSYVGDIEDIDSAEY